ncbi:uncharacterized protein LOC124488279 [Hypomesus transpacificus]|uniref:uncharacterized protein LOC124488279 n=1 Tax=Hypomesus transpacificus TaxID=137520 RepID=UPI001F0739E7|nr:uncharacterized protein LOC124488279 [Hypomesus transpacificus]
MLKQWVVASSRSAAPGPVDAQSLQITIEALFVSICQKKHYLYRQNDRNKRRQKITQKIAQEKKRFLEDIQRYNQQPDGDLVDTELVVQKLSNRAAESMIWPWQEQNTDSVDILTKKKLFDHVILASRLKEEKQILVKEMLQHCQYLKDSVAKVQTLMGTVLVSTQTGSLPNGLTEEGSKGLISALKRRLQDLRLQQQTIAGTYRCTLKPSNRLVEEDDREMDWDREMDREKEKTGNVATARMMMIVIRRRMQRIEFKSLGSESLSHSCNRLKPNLIYCDVYCVFSPFDLYL